MSEKKKWIFIFFGLLAAIFLVYKIFFSTKKDTIQIYKTVQVTRETIEKTILTTGLVQPYNRLEVKPPIPGRAEEVLVKEGNFVRKGQVLAWMSSTERAALLDAARAQGAAALKHWETLYKPTPLMAPLDGIIIARNVQSGQTVAQADAVLVMSDRLIVKAQVDETDIGEVKIGEKVQVVLDAYPKNKILGQVDHIAYEAQIVNNVTVYQVDVVVEKIPDFMRSGMTANVTFLVAQKENVLIIPFAAVRQEKKETFVTVANPQDLKKTISKEVKLGLNDGKNVEVLSGLNEGETVFIKNSGGRLQQNKAGSPLASPFGGAPRR